MSSDVADEEKLGALRGKHVFFGTPSKDWMVSGAFHDSMMRTRDVLRELGVTVTTRLMVDGGILLARSRLAMAALGTTATHLFNIDADLAFRPEDVVRLLAHDLPLVGGHYAHRERHRGAAVPGAQQIIGEGSILAPCRPRLMRNPDGTLAFDDVRELLETNALTGGFMCIRRDVLEETIAAYDAELGIVVGQERLTLVFDRGLFGEHPKTWASEDTAFCLRWLALGGGRKVWIDGKCRFEHIGPAAYASPSVEELLGLNFAPVALRHGA